MINAAGITDANGFHVDDVSYLNRFGGQTMATMHSFFEGGPGNGFRVRTRFGV